MNKVIITTILILSFLHGTGQTSSWGNPDYLSFYTKFQNKIDTIQINEEDFEVRLWFNNGGNRINTASFVSLTKSTDKWTVSYYTITSFPRRNDSIIIHRQEAVKLNNDSLYNQLLQEGLLSLNSDTINDLMDKKGQYSWMWTDSGPTNYMVQIVTHKKRWAVNYKCPKYFYNEAKIDEFKVPLQVISTLLKLIGLEPC